MDLTKEEMRSSGTVPRINYGEAISLQNFKSVRISSNGDRRGDFGLLFARSAHNFPNQPPLEPLGEMMLQPPNVQRKEDDVASVSEGSTVESSYSALSMPPLVGDDTPVVPLEVLRNSAEPLPWQGHPSAPIVLSLLNARGVFLPAQKDMVAYHMAPSFLHALHHLQLGSYFIKYASRNSAPKERFFSIKMLDNGAQVVVPYLCWTLHQHGMQLIDKVPLSQLVGVSKGPGELAFQRYMVTGNVIKGCRQGPHHAKLPANGAFTLWFFDRRKQVARSLSLLTCSLDVFDMWTKTMQALVAVNSASVHDYVWRGQTSEMDALLKQAQADVRNRTMNDEFDEFDE